jgi:hypothetical protein
MSLVWIARQGADFRPRRRQLTENLMTNNAGAAYNKKAIHVGLFLASNLPKLYSLIGIRDKSEMPVIVWIPSLTTMFSSTCSLASISSQHPIWACRKLDSIRNETEGFCL